MPQTFKTTIVWLKVMSVLASLSAGAPLFVFGCSSSQPPRDTNYGTDVGFAYVPPNTRGSSSADVAPINDASGTPSGRRDARPAPDSGIAPADVQASDGASSAEGGGALDGGVAGGMPCNPTCSGVACGSFDGCGSICSIGCVCFPSCAGVLCGGSDGCGGVCTFGCLCIPSCGPLDCDTADGCGGTCTFGCSCTPNCSGDECGTPDECGGTCDDGCFCSPSCGAFDCGASDGCGGLCDDGC